MGARKRKVRPTEILTLPVDPMLKHLVGKAADAAGLPMNEYVANVLAKVLGRPELGKIPRKAFGRPRKEIVA